MALTNLVRKASIADIHLCMLRSRHQVRLWGHTTGNPVYGHPSRRRVPPPFHRHSPRISSTPQRTMQKRTLMLRAGRARLELGRAESHSPAPCLSWSLATSLLWRSPGPKPFAFMMRLGAWLVSPHKAIPRSFAWRLMYRPFGTLQSIHPAFTTTLTW